MADKRLMLYLLLYIVVVTAAWLCFVPGWVNQ